MIEAAEVVLPCADLAATLAFFTERLQFRLDAIEPADDPREAVLSAHGIRVRLRRGDGPPGVLRLSVRDRAGFAACDGLLIAPNGTHVEIVSAPAPERVLPELPPLRPEFAIARAADATWKAGRAVMRYRDLLPGRQGGRFAASLIEIAAGGPVPDYVHFHRVHLQLLYCWRGSALLVYEDQGAPSWLQSGDCVLQPPTIRHRVLESSPGLQVVEFACPAEHETLVDHDLQLPTARGDLRRRWHGQRFVHSRADEASWQPCAVPGFAMRDLGIGAATDGRCAARVFRCRGAADPGSLLRADGATELRFLFMLAGAAEVSLAGLAPTPLAAGDACSLPPGVGAAVGSASEDVELLDVTVPAAALAGRAGR